MLKSIKDVSLADKKVIVRADLDATLVDGKVSDDFRLQSITTTIKYLLSQHVKQIILCGHLGRPKGTDPELTLQPVYKQLADLIEHEIKFVADIFGTELPNEKVIGLENLKYWPEEKGNEDNFARKLADLADVYVNESFATSHHNYASIVSIAKYTQEKYAGIQLMAEIDALDNFWKKATHPITFLLGGAKTDKISSIRQIIEKCDQTLVSGVFMNDDQLKSAPSTVYPEDNRDGNDIGEKAITQFKEKLKPTKTVLWNGPPGKFEEDTYAHGTRELANYLAEQTQIGNLKSYVGGGNTISALRKFGVLENMTFVSTGGGALLKLLAENTLPGIEVLK